MSQVFALEDMDSHTFEQMANSLALCVLGSGLTSFGPGRDGGRDGLFVGTAPYPSTVDNWSGTWYLQSKYHKPHLSKNHHEWLLEQIKDELKSFEQEGPRNWPDIWIVVTNIDPSGVPETGAYDKAKNLVKQARPALAERFAIWGGAKVLHFLGEYPRVAERYGKFLTPGHVLAALAQHIASHTVSSDAIVEHLVFALLQDERHARLEDVGDAGRRPDIHELFVDLPYATEDERESRSLLADAARASAEHYSDREERDSSEDWKHWFREPKRCPVWLLLAGPGKGKTTLGQMMCQIHRAAIVLSNEDTSQLSEIRELATQVRDAAQELNAWPLVPRIPIRIDLSRYASWYVQRGAEPKGLLTFISHKLHTSLEEQVGVNTLKQCLAVSRWLLVCDGLDEVPSESKREIADELLRFSITVRHKSDLMLICTTRPQGYEGQLDELRGSQLRLLDLDEEEALACANRLLKACASPERYTHGMTVLSQAIKTQAVRQLMVTPLQIHIMTIVIRGGQHPPEKKWKLFDTFYRTIYARELSKNLGGGAEAELLRKEEKLITAVHRALGFVLHARAETTEGALAALPQPAFRELVNFLVTERKEANSYEILDTLCRTATDRLVLISTPDSRESVRFDIRQLQEFFAAEFLLEGVRSSEFTGRLRAIISESHWREVIHFLLSAIIEQERHEELAVSLAILHAANLSCVYGDAPALGNLVLLGSMMAADLLLDGVLEANKRIREQFRPLIQMLVKRRDCVRLLRGVQSAESRSWLIRLLREQLRELNEEFSIGASALLFYLSENDVDSIIKMWTTWNVDNQRSAIGCLAHVSRGAQIGSSASIAKLLVSDELGPLTGELLMRIDHPSAFEIVTIVCKHLGSDATAVLESVVPTYREHEHKDYGWVMAFTGDSFPRLTDALERSALDVLAGGASGFVKLCADIVRLRRSRDPSLLLSILTSGSKVSRWLYNRLRGLMPELMLLDVVSAGELEKLYQAHTAEELAVRCTEVQARHFDRFELVSDGKGTPEQAAEFARVQGGLAIFLATIGTPNFASALSAHDPHALIRLVDDQIEDIAKNAHAWPRLIGLYPGFLEKLRARSTTSQCAAYVGSDLDSQQFVLNLDLDSDLLCAVASALVGDLSEVMNMLDIGYSDEDRNIGRIRAVAARWITDIEKLAALARSNPRPEVLFAAVICGALHPSGGVEFVHSLAEHIRRAVSAVGDDGALGLVLSLNSIDGLGNDWCRELADEIVEAHPRANWSELADSLSSRSLGTVARSGNIARWLNAQRGPEWLM